MVFLCLFDEGILWDSLGGVQTMDHFALPCC